VIPKLGRGGRPLRIAYARVFQEANAFSPLPTTREDFEVLHCLDSAELARATRLRGYELKGYLRQAELTGFVQAARLAGDVEVVPLWSTFAISGGPLTPEAFAWLVEGTLERLRAAGPVDGVYLALHGSMQVRDLGTSPEGVLLAKVRELIGDKAGLAVSYDLHANLATPMIDPCDVVVAYHTNPHRDLFGTGFRAGNLLVRTLRDRCKPVHAWRKLPMVLGGGLSIDFLAPMRSVFRRMKAMEQQPGVLSANLFMVHPYSDATDLGWATHVTTDGDQELAEHLADELAQLAWDQRRVPLPEMFSPADALDGVKKSLWRKLGAVSLVDVDDIVGTGAPGGNTHLLAEASRDDRGLRTYLPLHDPAAVDELWSGVEGERVDITLRGSPGYDSQPHVALSAVLTRKVRTDFGRTVRLDCGKLHVAVTERPPYTLSPRFWSSLDLEARKADVIVQKALFHYRIFYAASSFRHIGVVSDGASSLKRVIERKYEVPTWPGENPEDWRRYDPILRRLE
jgi:microcystin degradation protein MlrC